MKILITDHRPFVRSGLKALLSKHPETECCREAGTKELAIRSIRQNPPDILITNWKFCTTSGLDLITEARDAGYRGKSLLLADYVTQQEFQQVRQYQIEGLIASTAIEEEFLHALTLIQMGRCYYDARMLERFFGSASAGIAQSEPHHQLTNKELEVLEALGHGYSNRQIAEALFITEYTVKKHVSQILAKLELADRTHAALYANARGIARYEIGV